MLPLSTTATIFRPFADIVTCLQVLEGAELASVQVVPEFAEIHILPLFTTAVNFVPSADEAIARQSCVLPTSDQELPEFSEAQIFPPSTVALILSPSEETVT